MCDRCEVRRVLESWARPSVRDIGVLALPFLALGGVDSGLDGFCLPFKLRHT